MKRTFIRSIRKLSIKKSKGINPTGIQMYYKAILIKRVALAQELTDNSSETELQTQEEF